MNVTTATPSATTPKTQSTATAPSAISPTPIRIDDFVKRHLAEASSEDSSVVIATAQRARSLGFKSCANVRYTDFLEAFRSSPHLSSVYAEKYPACCFLPWPAFHNVRRVLNLWCDLPEFYAGAVPAEQIPWMEIFEMNREDIPRSEDFCSLIELNNGRDRWIQEILEPGRTDVFGRTDGQWMQEFVAAHWRETESRRQEDSMRGAFKTLRESFFVVAPPEAFTSTEDIITRIKKMMVAQTRITTAPNDPLVVRFCVGGCLVVAAWGDEAAELNQRVKDLGI